MKFEIAPKSTQQLCDWDSAVVYCFSLGDGWRIPTIDELSEIAESKHDLFGWYWSADECGDSVWCIEIYSGTLAQGHIFRFPKVGGEYGREGLIRAIRDIK